MPFATRPSRIRPSTRRRATSPCSSGYGKEFPSVKAGRPRKPGGCSPGCGPQVEHGDPFAKCLLAHSMADVQEDPHEEVRCWRPATASSATTRKRNDTTNWVESTSRPSTTVTTAGASKLRSRSSPPKTDNCRAALTIRRDHVAHRLATRLAPASGTRRGRALQPSAWPPAGRPTGRTPCVPGLRRKCPLGTRSTGVRRDV